ncbi:DUF917 domain-containing protein [Rhodococcus sp. JS3073]|uniref:DUF917 domain-containing protein n=1 Tax=Rhodococcus sp. JS3073 TaxID=3002901 RepID=UPI002285D8B4|nr:DUF917 domain-containing protein [Rhodococcus sp. JS3073]WAM19957.1 DUF917 domain-containing protein [Rhodococcus sp. JS3073]
MLLDEELLEDMAIGATILAVGGGGDPYIGKLLAREAIRKYGPIPVIDLADVPDDARLAFVAGLGAPGVLNEKLPRAEEIIAAVEVLEDHLGYRFTHLVPGEAGGLNAILPATAAAAHGIPMVDADGMGRAFPYMDLVTPTLHGGRISPMSIVDEHGNRIVLTSETNAWAEAIGRAAMVASGCMTMTALYPMTGAQAKQWLVGGTVSLAARLGRTVRTARADHRNPVDAIVDEHGAVRLFDGKVVDVARRIEGGWNRGEAVLDGIDAFGGQSMRVGFQNEYLIATLGGETVATTPDLIMTVILETGEPIPAEEIRYGYRVAVLGLSSDRQWRTDDGLALAGPRRFGYDLDFVPVCTPDAARPAS